MKSRPSPPPRLAENRGRQARKMGIAAKIDKCCRGESTYCGRRLQFADFRRFGQPIGDWKSPPTRRYCLAGLPILPCGLLNRGLVSWCLYRGFDAFPPENPSIQVCRCRDQLASVAVSWASVLQPSCWPRLSWRRWVWPNRCEAAEDGMGYTDTPRLPNSPWRVHDRTRPQPPMVCAGQCARATPPSDAVILFDGKDLSQWEVCDAQRRRAARRSQRH